TEFTFQITGPHADLHSFPTRRSSDLATTWRGAAPARTRPRTRPRSSTVTRSARTPNRNSAPAARAASTSTRSSSVRRGAYNAVRSEEHTSELQSQSNVVCRLLLEKKY